jgi:predicted O-methyltransferase YrrM
MAPVTGTHYLMGIEHRKLIAEALPRGGRMLEWGAGNSTFWMRKNCPDATIFTIEHTKEWADKIGAEYRPAEVGQNATIGEEYFRGDITSYVHAGVGRGPFDVIFVDGVLRNLCMLAAKDWLAPHGVIFLHDAQRDWYATGKMAYQEIDNVEACPDYPGPTLWVGKR